jgi:hypothetical protein
MIVTPLVSNLCCTLNLKRIICHFAQALAVRRKLIITVSRFKWQPILLSQ